MGRVFLLSSENLKITKLYIKNTITTNQQWIHHPTSYLEQAITMITCLVYLCLQKKRGINGTLRLVKWLNVSVCSVYFPTVSMNSVWLIGSTGTFNVQSDRWFSTVLVSWVRVSLVCTSKRRITELFNAKSKSKR